MNETKIMQESENNQPNAAPAATGEQTGNSRTFTQEEVNQIVSDRLSRERSKIAGSDSKNAEKEAELTARENKLQCKEFVSENPSYPEKLLEILDTSNFEEFKKQADKLMEAFPWISPKAPRFGGPTPGIPISSDLIAEAFKPRS